jgi:DNA-binding HxlR family transcriptional regulator
MHKETDMLCLCPVEEVVNKISRKWAIMTISVIGNHGKMRFNEIKDHHIGLTPKTLADLLKCLQEEGLIKRESFNEIPPRVEYSLTDEGEQLREALIPLLKWADQRGIASPAVHGSQVQKKNRAKSRP